MSYTYNLNGVSDDEINQSVEDSANEFMDIAEDVFDLLGYDTAVDNLRRYRSGEGGTRSYTAEEMNKHPAYGDAIDHNRSLFESKTFTGNTSNSTLNRTLRGLRDGEVASFSDHWNRNINAFDKFGTPSKTNFSQPSTYFSFGRSSVYSDGDFSATRKGRNLTISGNVLNRLGDDTQDTEVFDFNPGQIGSSEARVLERSGLANPFAMDYRRRQTVEARGRYEPDGTITILRALWGDLE
jgi:hypothetical protein